MKIAMMGTRGIPANYGGFETCVEAVSTRLAARGHQVTVYNRPHHVKWTEPTYQGVRLVRLPTIANKYLDTPVHTALAAMHASIAGADIVLVFVAANSPMTLIPRLAGRKTILHVDGLDWKRDKWPGPAKRYIRAAEWLGTHLPHAVITDSRVVQQYYRDTFDAHAEYIAYGADVEPLDAGATLAQFGLREQDYLLFVGRLVPENRIHTLIEAYRGLNTDKKCVIVGHAPYAEKYIAELKAMAGPNVVFTGYQFGAAYRELSSHAYLFVEPSTVGGTHPALVEAMGFGNCVVAHDTPENRETIGDAGFGYNGHAPAASLQALLQRLVDGPHEVGAARARARDRAQRYFSWEQVTDAYETLFRRMLDVGVPAPRAVDPRVVPSRPDPGLD
ncbi:MAG TPA: glycosyltransferase [Chloroflexia bacterium]|nr:glycosyltransferase [Chloroflexia bacterium]